MGLKPAIETIECISSVLSIVTFIETKEGMGFNSSFGIQYDVRNEKSTNVLNRHSYSKHNETVIKRSFRHIVRIST